MTRKYFEKNTLLIATQSLPLFCVRPLALCLVNNFIFKRQSSSSIVITSCNKAIMYQNEQNRSSHRRNSINKCVHKNFAKFTRKEAFNFVKKETPTQVSFYDFCKIFEEHLRKAGSNKKQSSLLYNMTQPLKSARYTEAYALVEMDGIKNAFYPHIKFVFVFI